MSLHSWRHFPALQATAKLIGPEAASTWAAGRVTELKTTEVKSGRSLGGDSSARWRVLGCRRRPMGGKGRWAKCTVTDF